MDIETVTQLVSSVGFPIVMSLLFFFYVKDTQEGMTNAITELKESIDKLYAMITHMQEKGELK